MEARRPSRLGRAGRRRDHGPGARGRPRRASASACRSRQRSKTRGRSSPRRTASVSSSTAGSPSSCRSARSCRWGRGSRAWSTSPRCRRTTSISPSRWSRPGEELWVKIIDLDLQRRRISLSIKQAAEGGEVAEEYREHFGEHAYDAQGNYIGTPITADDADRKRLGGVLQRVRRGPRRQPGVTRRSARCRRRGARRSVRRSRRIRGQRSTAADRSRSTYRAGGSFGSFRCHPLSFVGASVMLTDERRHIPGAGGASFAPEALTIARRLPTK